MLNIKVEDATKILSLSRQLNNYKAPFRVLGEYKLIDNGVTPEATVHIEADNQIIHEASNGNGPVDALANVLRKALAPLFPEITKVKLADYEAKILDARHGTNAEVEVTIIFTDGEDLWKVYCMSGNINYASFCVLIDGFEYAIQKERRSI
ncbi:MAG TPA: alpha-isopropylmalate synthase regulatory domain-containing protein [Spirochaetota bacterium]|jgi:2-isopropylmalate synthase|nr:alpha-isopropylmalate synthase regulatory domain-containing protein [Spirochaetota bacterium]HPS86881.1 alpha-isopropylmalate synthase regulatory domain-containing protein [Spirochaetota bacterium]